MSGFKLLPTALENLVVFVCLLMSVGFIFGKENGKKLAFDLVGVEAGMKDMIDDNKLTWTLGVDKRLRLFHP